MDGGSNEIWMGALAEFIVEHGLHHTFWCLNPNSGDTGGLLLHDWITVDQQKYNSKPPFGKIGLEDLLVWIGKYPWGIMVLM